MTALLGPTFGAEVLADPVLGHRANGVAFGPDGAFLPGNPSQAEQDALAALIAAHDPTKQPVRKVPKVRVLARVEAAGKGDAATDLLLGNKKLFRRWTLPGKDYVNSDDPDTRAVLTVLGLDPDAILAP